MTEPSLGDPLDRRYRPKEGHPRPSQGAPLRRWWRSRRATARGPGRSPPSWASRRPTARTRRCSPTDDVDAVYIPLPNHLHAEWTIAAARAGKHVLCEKPLAMTAAEADEMVDVCAREGVRLMEAFMYRLHPSWVAVRELVASGRIGRLGRSRAGSRTSTTTRPTSATRRDVRWRRPVRHRLLLREPVPDAVRRGAGPGQRHGSCAIPRPASTS